MYSALITAIKVVRYEHKWHKKEKNCNTRVAPQCSIIIADFECFVKSGMVHIKKLFLNST